jgi:hypothetical protein
MSDEVIKKLEARIAELEAKVNPPAAAPEAPRKPYQPPDYTAQFSPGVKLTGRERYRTDQTPEQALNDARKERNPVGRLMPLAQFLNKGQPLPDPPPAVGGGTIPTGKVPGIDHIDRIAKGFADRERAEELAKLVDVASKLKGL